jgi:hypothetical protein
MGVSVGRGLGVAVLSRVGVGSGVSVLTGVFVEGGVSLGVAVWGAPSVGVGVRKRFTGVVAGVVGSTSAGEATTLKKKQEHTKQIPTKTGAINQGMTNDLLPRGIRNSRIASPSVVGVVWLFPHSNLA